MHLPGRDLLMTWPSIEVIVIVNVTTVRLRLPTIYYARDIRFEKTSEIKFKIKRGTKRITSIYTQYVYT